MSYSQRENARDSRIQELKRGDVYLANITFPGYPTKEGAVKYVVILQEGHLFTKSTTVSVLLLTTKHLDSIFPTDVYLEPKECKAITGAKILANQPYTILKSQLRELMYSLSKETLNEMDTALTVGVGIVDI